MYKYDVVLLTEGRYEQPSEVDWYIQQILTEDGLVHDALLARGLRVTRKDWANPDFDWSSTRVALFRTTWDYFHRFGEFSTWLEKVSKQTQLLNTAAQIRWNLDKHYLQDLAAKGINIPETLFIEVGDQRSLQELHDATGWTKTVLKPTISGAGRHTYKLDLDNLEAHEAIHRELIAKEAMLLQPFQEQIVTKGEVGLMVFGGKYSHAVLKRAKAGDFRVQDDFGGTIDNYTPSAEEIAFAEKVVAVCDPVPIYARVDLIWDNNDQTAVSELELIEPELWFREHQPAAGLLADAIVRYLQ